MPQSFNVNNSNDNPTQRATDWGNRFRRFVNRAGWLIIFAVLIIYLAQGIYQVKPSEIGLVKRFGRHVKTAGPGLNYHLPPPVESVQLVDIKTVRKVEIGYKTISPPPNPQYAIQKDEALMLTGDDNIVHLELAVQYTVADPEKFGFNLIDPQALVKEASEAIIRQQVVKRTVEEVLTSERAEIALDADDSLQALLDKYETGIRIETIKIQDAKPPESVVPAFDDVTSAKEDKNRLINESQAYSNEVIPEARGEAAEVVNQAEAYKQEQINASQGEVSRFLRVLEEYNIGSKQVTRKRLYLETLENILPPMNKVVLTDSKNGDSILKLLNLSDLDTTGEGE